MHEKGKTDREIPIHLRLLVRMQRMVRERGKEDPDAPVVYHKNGAPLTRRRYNTLFDVCKQLSTGLAKRASLLTGYVALPSPSSLS